MPQTVKPTPRSVSSWPIGAHVTLSSSTGSFASPASIGPNGMSGGGPTVPRMARSPWSARSHGSHRAPQHRRPGRASPLYPTPRPSPRLCSSVKDLGTRAKADPGVPFLPKVLGALALVKRCDPPIWARTKAALKQAGVSMRDLSDAVKPYRARPALRLVQPGEAPALRRVVDDLPDAPAENLIMPAGYVLTPTATLYTPQSASADAANEAARERLVARAPLLSTGRLTNRDEQVEAYAAQALSAEAGRLAQYVAAIEVTARLVHAALDLPWAYSDPFEALWADIAAEAAEASGEERALRDVVSWAYAHQSQFYGRSPLDGITPPKGLPTGTAGRWDAEPEWTVLAFYPTVLRQVLRELGYEPEAILGGWRQRGWLEVDQDRDRYAIHQEDAYRPGPAPPRHHPARGD